jgi:hypothetical protein
MGDSGGGFASIGSPLDGPQADGAYGTSVCGAGDVDGDLRDDVIVGAPEAERAFVHAHAIGTWSLVWALQDDSSSLFGTSVAAANLTADAVPDLIVGAPEDDDAGPDAGSVIVFDGATGGVVYEASGSVPLGSYFGYSVAACEDLDGDGVQELLVGVPEANPSNTGAVRLLSGATGATLYTLFGDAPEDGLGECVAAIGDVTGDGRPEIIAGAPQVPDMGQAGPGYVRVYTGWGAIGSNYCGPAVVNSSGDPGVIHALGSHVAADSDVSLVAVQLPTNKFGYFLNSMSAGSIDNPGGSQGKLCLSGAIGRYQQLVQNTGDAGSATLVLDLSQTPTPSGPVAVQAGETWRFQLWFRDNNPGPTSNFTDAVAITFQ